MQLKRIFLFGVAFYISYIILFKLWFLYQIQIQATIFSYPIDYLLINPWLCAQTIYNELTRNLWVIFVPIAIVIILSVISEKILTLKLTEIHGLFDFTIGEKNSFVIELFSLIFYIMHFFSLYWLLKQIVRPKQDDRRWLDFYVLGSLLFSLFLVFWWPAINVPELKLILVFLMMLRIIEILIIQINALFFDWYRAGKAREVVAREKVKEDRIPYKIRGYLRITLLLLVNYVEIVFIFGVFYQYYSWAFSGMELNPIKSLNFSFYTMTTFGHVAESTLVIFGYVLTMTQAAIGLFMALLILSRFIALFPKAPSDDKAEKFLEDEAKKSN